MSENRAPAFHYFLHGLVVSSEIPLRDYTVLEDHTTLPDVVIRYKPVPDFLTNSCQQGVLYQSRPGHYLLTVPGVARYYVRYGQSIDVHRLTKTSSNDIELFLMDKPIVALLLQRGLLALRASAIMTDEGAIAFAGISGVGKSAIVAALGKRNYPMLADDLTTITPSPDHEPLAWTGAINYHLWWDTCELLEINPNPNQKLRQGIEKYRIAQCHRKTVPMSVPLRALYVISVKNRSDTTIDEIRGRHKIHTLIEQCVSTSFSEQPGTENSTLVQLMQYASMIKVRRLTIQRSRTGFDELIENISATLTRAGNKLASYDNRQSASIATGKTAKRGTLPPDNRTAMAASVTANFECRSSNTSTPSDRLDRVIWLASYPKSGNTWLRVFLTNYLSDKDTPSGINTLAHNKQTGLIASQRHLFDAYTGIKSSCLTHSEIDRLRPGVYSAYARSIQDSIFPQFIKIHDALRRLSTGDYLIPTCCTAGVIYIVRNPLDVVLSYSAHFNVSVDKSISILNDPNHCLAGDYHQLPSQLRQKMLTWSGHVESWNRPNDFPMILIRYEDMHQHPEKTFRKVLEFTQIPFHEKRLSKALKHSQLEQLRKQEETDGFIENPSANRFFRRGTMGGWKYELSSEQIERLVSRHQSAMLKSGYLTESGELIH